MPQTLFPGPQPVLVLTPLLFLILISTLFRAPWISCYVLRFTFYVSRITHVSSGVLLTKEDHASLSSFSSRSLVVFPPLPSPPKIFPKSPSPNPPACLNPINCS